MRAGWPHVLWFVCPFCRLFHAGKKPRVRRKEADLRCSVPCLLLLSA